MLMFEFADISVSRKNRSKTKNASLKEHNAIFALQLSQWLAIDERVIIRALLVLLPEHPPFLFFLCVLVDTVILARLSSPIPIR